VNGAFRIYPQDKAAAAQLAVAVVELAHREGWKLDALHTEEGQLDEVFRGLTRPDTARK
jgi:ABC-2 type transport system ATP-binding protein